MRPGRRRTNATTALTTVSALAIARVRLFYQSFIQRNLRKDCQQYQGASCTSDADCGNFPGLCQATDGRCNCPTRALSANETLTRVRCCRGQPNIGQAVQ